MKSLSNTAISAIFAAVITLAVGIALARPFGVGLEAWMSDRMQTWRYELLKKTDPAKRPDPRLILAAVDQQSVTDLGRWPLPRATDAEFLGVLAPAQPKVVGWDVLFTEVTAASPTQAPPPNSGPPPLLQPDDQALVDAAKLIPHMVHAAQFDRDGSNLRDENLLPTRPLKDIRGDVTRVLSYPRAIVPFPELRQVNYFGFVDAPPDDQRRLMPLVVNIDGQVFASLSLQILLQYWGDDPDQVVVNLGHEVTLPRSDGTLAHIPIDDEGRFLVNYRVRTADFQSLSYSVMGKGLADIANNQTSRERSALPPLKDNIVMVGVTLSGTDEGPIPIDSYSPLVIAHLNVLNNILQGDYLHILNLWIWLPIYLVFLFGVANAMLRVGISPMIPIGLGAVLVGFAAAFCALWFGNLLIPILIPEVGVLILSGAVPTKRFFGEEREKMRIKGAMRAYLSDKVMAKVLEHPDNLKLGGVKQEITIMFCDIRGFTAYCDHRDPQETMDVLNEYMEIMTQVVFKFDGTIDKYIGDCIMAFWNAPEPQPDHAQRAVLCAMEMRQALATFKTQRAGQDAELFECGIGIHTGEALVGNMGSSLKRNYTAMGSTVNLGARLESLTKALHERILISEDTFLQLHDPLPITDRGEVEVSGFDRPVHVYAVVTEQVIAEALRVGRILAGQQEYSAEEVQEPLYEPTPLPEEAAPDQEPS
jgi:adenylate cyclase